jgi:hypothetical protein
MEALSPVSYPINEANWLNGIVRVTPEQLATILRPQIQQAIQLLEQSEV